MEFLKYSSLIKEITFGKKLPEALYIHACGISAISHELAEFIGTTIQKLQLTSFSYDIIKFHLREFKISLLKYPDFWDAPYPELKASCTIDLLSYRTKLSSYEKTDNPPILHRKETFLPLGHPRRAEFQQITRDAEDAGLFENVHTIGFKQNWLKKIKIKGYILNGNRLEKIQPSPNCASSAVRGIHSDANPEENEQPPRQINRHLTAINRTILSSPMQSLYNHGFLDGACSVFDYGCGKGDDVRELKAHGIEAIGWDPVYNPGPSKLPSDIVNLGFVINVIEKPSERVMVLQEAFSLTKKVMSVSVMLGGEGTTSKYKPFGDGVVTSRGTFQKYYSQQEIRLFIENHLEKNAIAVAPGVFFVFANDDDEQVFLSERQRRQFDWKTLTVREPKARIPVERLSKLEKNQALIDDFKNSCLSLGRLCKPDEFEYSAQVRKLFGSMTKGFSHIMSVDPEPFLKARRARIEDLLVFFGLTLFSKRKPYKHMPKSLQRDVQEFFGDYRTALEQAKTLLFSVGNPQNIHKACIEANAEGLGYLDNDHSLILHTSLIQALPAILRLYVGCATQLYGDVDKADLVKIHIQSGKVSLMRYDDFAHKRLPQLVERIKIKLREQEIDFFDYTTQSKIQLLYLKSRYISKDFPSYTEQLTFDRYLQTIPGFDFSGFGPPAEEILSFIERSSKASRKSPE